MKRSFRITPTNEPDDDMNPDLSNRICKKSSGSSKGVNVAISVEKVPSIQTDQLGSPAAVKSKVKEADEIDDLCSIFQSTLKVDDSTLKVDTVNMKRTSPMPKEGRYTTMVPKSVPDGGDLYLAVKRSVRTISEHK